MVNHHSQSRGESEASTGSTKGSKTPSSKVPTVLLDQDRMMLIHRCSSLCLNLVLMILLAEHFYYHHKEGGETENQGHKESCTRN